MRGIPADRYLEFQTRLRCARLEANLTQHQVARSLGVSQSWVSKCESGERRVDILELRLLSDLYGKPIDFFVPRSPT